MAKLIGYARVSTREQITDRQTADILAAGVRADDLYIDHGVSGARASRPAWDRARQALQPGDTLVVTTLDRLGRSTENMLHLSTELQEREINLRVLNLGGTHVDTNQPMGRMVFTVMAALAEMEREIKLERMRDSVAKRRAGGGNLGGRPSVSNLAQARAVQASLDDPTDSRSAMEVAKDLGFTMSRATLFRRLQELRELNSAKEDQPQHQQL